MRILTLILALTVGACASDDDRVAAGPEVIRVGVLPDQSEASLSTQYGKLADYLESAAGVEIVLSIPPSYQDLLDQFNAGQLDMANFGGITFIQAERSAGAVPLVMRDIDLEFLSCYLVRASDSRQSIAEFENERFSFGPRLSTSGHIMPRHFLGLSGVIPEDFFASLRYSSGHDQTAHWVADGTVAIGVANCRIVQSMLSNNGVSAGALRILDSTPPYSNYVWAIQQSVTPAVSRRLRDAFLALDMTDAAHRELLTALGANGYLPAGKSDFDSARTAAIALGLLNPEVPD